MHRNFSVIKFIDVTLFNLVTTVFSKLEPFTYFMYIEYIQYTYQKNILTIVFTFQVLKHQT